MIFAGFVSQGGLGNAYGHWKPAAGWLQQLRSYSFARAAVIARGVVLTRAQPKVQGELHVN